jgi:hypothetical protein
MQEPLPAESKSIESGSTEGPAALPDAPIEAFAAACDRIKMTTLLMTQPPAGRDSHWERTVLTALRVDIPRLLADEGEDLFPILQLAARKTDDVETILKRLRGNQDELRARITASLGALEAATQDPGRALDGALTSELAALAAQVRQHVSLLSAIVLPIARLRLTLEDMSILGAGMATRRGD